MLSPLETEMLGSLGKARRPGSPGILSSNETFIHSSQKRIQYLVIHLSAVFLVYFSMEGFQQRTEVARTSQYFLLKMEKRDISSI